MPLTFRDCPYVADFVGQARGHSIRAFASYRLRPTWNVSGRFAFGTGLLLAGFFEQRGPEFFVSQQRNILRLPNYQRTDLRVNKAFLGKRVQWTVFAEVVNVTNRRNVRFDEIGSLDPGTGRVRLRLERTFPVLPSAGVVVDF